ncbi:MAG: DUF4132 domain-containing protein [Planctomycetota bacterium]
MTVPSGIDENQPFQDLVCEAAESVIKERREVIWREDLKRFPSLKPIYGCKRSELGQMIIATFEVATQLNAVFKEPGAPTYSEVVEDKKRYADFYTKRLETIAVEACRHHLMLRKLPAEKPLGDLLHSLMYNDKGELIFGPIYLDQWLSFVESWLNKDPLPEDWLATCMAQRDQDIEYETVRIDREVKGRLRQICSLAQQKQHAIGPSASTAPRPRELDQSRTESFKTQIVELIDSLPASRYSWHTIDSLKRIEQSKQLLAVKKAEHLEMIAAAKQLYETYERAYTKELAAWARTGYPDERDSPSIYDQADHALHVVMTILAHLLSRTIPLERWIGELLCTLLSDTREMSPIRFNQHHYLEAWLNFAEEWMAREPLPEQWVQRCVSLYTNDKTHYETSSTRETKRRLATLAGLGSAAEPPLVPGDAWSDAVFADLEEMEPIERSAWIELLNHAASLHISKPSKKWKKLLGPLLEPVGLESVVDHAIRWAGMIGQPGTIEHQIDYYEEHTNNTLLDGANADVLRGLCWIASADVRAVCMLHTTALACCKKIRGRLRDEPVANAAIRALASMPGDVGLIQLVQLEQLVRVPKPKKLIAKMVAEVAEREGLDVEMVRQSSVPGFGLVDGVVRLPFDDYSAEITVQGDQAKLQWIKPDGKATRVIPKAVREAHPGAKDEVKGLITQIESVLPAQRRRIEKLTRAENSWPVKDWQRDYLEHGLVSTIARRLIWVIDGTACLYHNGAMRDINGDEVDLQGEVMLWHPLGRPTEDVVAWRHRVERLEITQPFKQAHREVYLVTDAERNTNVYSNRFASHILKNATVVALCQTRGWVSGLFGGETGPRLDLPEQGVRAEFWVEPAGDNYTDYGAPKYLATDQVRFYARTSEDAHRIGHTGDTDDPLPVEIVPPRALSEAMRDVDLFVGIASVGNDPNWNDGGPDGRYRDYWHDYSFGDLTASAETRHEILERLIPRLKIANRCSFTKKFLVVRGDRRTYKIHMGSGNILMEPNDEYLCIVEGRGQKGTDGVFLPFEGDQRLAIILSKAMMLAEDTTITDSTILSQIGSKR